MKNYIFFYLLIFLLASCSVNETPVFIKLDNIKIAKANKGTIRLKLDALFENPNDVGGEIYTDEIKVFINKVEVAQVSSDKFTVPAKDKFTVPLTVIVPTKKIYEDNKNNFLSSLVNSVFNKSIEVTFKGVLKYKFLGFKKDFVVNEIQEIKL